MANQNAFRGLGLEGQLAVMVELYLDAIVAGVDGLVGGDVAAAVTTEVNSRLDALTEASAQALSARHSARLNRAMWGTA